MTEKELRKLSRGDLLRFALEQSRDAAQGKEALAGLAEEKALAEEQIEDLETLLGKKDEMLVQLKEELEDKDAILSELRRSMDALRSQLSAQREESSAIAEEDKAQQEENAGLHQLIEKLSARIEELDRANREGEQREGVLKKALAEKQERRRDDKKLRFRYSCTFFEAFFFVRLGAVRGWACDRGFRYGDRIPEYAAD